MQFLDTGEIINNIKAGKTFEAITPGKELFIRIGSYLPVVCTTLHAGHQLRPELVANCLLNDYERWYEEDPLTFDFVKDYSVLLCSLDSRYEYDLNRSEQEAIYETAWGKKVWKEPLSPSIKELSLFRYRTFYAVAEALIEKLEQQYPAVYLFDIHSYNYKRITRETPVFNLGTEGVDQIRFNREIDILMAELTKIKLDSVSVTVRKNDVFQGRGHFTLHISSRFINTLVFPLEIKKVYCDELTGEIFGGIADQISRQLTLIIQQFQKLVS